jgi:hypothetical protein
MKRILVSLVLLLTTSSLASGQTMVDAGGHRLNMLVAGEGSPTVILESGFAGDGVSFKLIRPKYY